MLLLRASAFHAGEFVGCRYLENVLLDKEGLDKHWAGRDALAHARMALALMKLGRLEGDEFRENECKARLNLDFSVQDPALLHPIHEPKHPVAVGRRLYSSYFLIEEFKSQLFTVIDSSGGDKFRLEYEDREGWRLHDYAKM